MSTSSFSSQLWNYDVFLSFRGEDTRKTFVDHLYKALVQQNIFTYKDDKTLVRGESIAPALLEAISLSGISVIVFSENYANSSWCLDELAHIMKCRDEIGTIVMPIFYHVDPSNVRKQKGKYGEAFAKHEFENNKNVESWRKALFEAGNIAGWEIKHVADGHESKEIKEIVNTISNRLFPLIPNVNERLIGIKSRFQDLESHLEIGLGGVSMVGIWGVGGGGKTTLASYVYNEISSNFVGCYFVENIRDESRKYGLEKLQTKLICNVLKQKHAEVGSVEEGRQMIKSELCTKKVLIVLDDVNHLDHLKALAGSHDWFGDGSRIIITTRDNDLLYAHKVDVIHKISLLDNKEDIKLFRKHAPQNYRPREDYDHLSKQVVSYAGGLPLALIVLSSFLCDKDMDEWRSAMERLKDIPETDIIKKLKISFDGLKQIEQELFLDIACLFVGEKKKDAMESLDACGFHSRIGVKVLLQKALVNINSDGKFDMHDLLQEMGHYIVRGEHPRNPEKHSRVWQVDDVTNICSMDDIDATTEFNKIEAIQIYSDMHDPLPHHNHHAVTNMKKLRWIDWRGHHASSLPKDFPQRELRCLILIKGHHKQLWNGYKHLPNLMMIKLHNLNNLTLTPDFSGLPNLERFVLNRSPCLEEIHESIGGLERLVFLLITGCNNLKMFPSITGIKNLETLSLSKCSKLITKSKKEVASYKQYSTNNFVTRLLPTLKESSLFLMGMNPTWSLQFISGGLKRLNLSNCHLGDEDIDSNVWELPNLQELDLSVNIFTRLSFRLLQLPRLKWLDVSSCNKLEVLFALPSSIAVLRADYCYSLDTLGDLSNCKWLWKVSFFGKNKLWPIDDVMLLDSMCQGYAIEHHFMSLALEHQVRKLYESSVVGQRRFILELPHNWCNDFSGFLIHCVIEYQEPYVTIIIKQEQQDEIECNYKNELFSNPPPPPTYIGYVSFSSLMRHATWLNSACNMISFTLGGKFSVKLVPRKSIGDNSVPESDWYFWDEEREDRKTFTIQRESKSSINILWSPC